MKIMIDIDENVFTRLFDNDIQDNEIAVDDVCEMARTLRLGTPLPEHHGRLIDADAVMDDICNSINEMTKIGLAVDGEYLWGKLNDAIDNAQTILKADVESEDKE